MSLTTGQNKLLSLQRRWKAESFAYCLLLSLSVSLLATSLLHIILRWPLWTGLPVLAGCFLAVLFFFPFWRVTVSDVARFLNKQVPELEESCELLLRPTGDLGPLEKLQATRTEARLAPLRAPRPLSRKLWRAAGWLVIAALWSAGIGMAGRTRAFHTGSPAVHAVVAVAEKPAPGIRSVSIRIVPPAYTGRTVRRQEVFNLRVEEGGLLNWEVQTNEPVRSLQFIFNDSIRLALQAADSRHRLWRATRPAVHSGFYQVDVEGRLSELYTLEVVKDEPPHITIQTPKPYTVIDYGEPTRIPLVVKLRDDYGIADAVVVAIIASGNGEAVKFKEQTIRFGRTFTGDQPAYDLQQTMDLSALGLKPGDELYFYCRAKDNHGQESRTDMYIVSLPDTAQLMSLQGLTLGVDVKPEYFRSERQIIIETEQLLKEKDTLSVKEFNNRSNDLGIDQKLLRVRYGKFLGEEAEEAEPGGEDLQKAGEAGKTGAGGRMGDLSRAGDVVKPGDVGDAAKILDAYTDKHDNAEDATYFEPAIKAQLKATLTEMWGAELRLRTFKPGEALPYAYKALRLLKDLQQRSRAYVAKTGVRVTPLDPAKRLAGKLEDIAPPVQRPAPGPGSLPVPEQVLRIALGLLEYDIAPGPAMGRGSLEILQEASGRLGREASDRPVEYLAGYQAMRRIMGGRAGAGDALQAQRAIRKLLPEAEAAPSAGKAPADAGLSNLYFSHINDPLGKP